MILYWNGHSAGPEPIYHPSLHRNPQPHGNMEHNLKDSPDVASNPRSYCTLKRIRAMYCVENGS